jgi:hypothetical protein
MASTSITYRVPSAWLAPGVLGMMGAMGTAFLILSLVQGGPWLFMIVWLAAVAWMSFNFLWKTPCEVVVEGGRLTWRGFWRIRTVYVTDISQLTLAYLGTIQVVEDRDGHRLWIPVMQGCERFIQSLIEAYPDLPVAPGRYARFVDRVRLGRYEEGNGETGKKS